MPKFTLDNLDSKYTVVNGYAAEFCVSITNQLCVRWGSDPWNNGEPYTAIVHDDGTVSNDDYDLGKLYLFESIDERTYNAIKTVNLAGFTVTSDNVRQYSPLERAQMVIKNKNRSFDELHKATHIPVSSLKAYRANPDKLKTAAWDRVDVLSGIYGLKSHSEF